MIDQESICTFSPGEAAVESTSKSVPRNPVRKSCRPRPIEADRDQIERALDAIVENAVNHTTAAESIQITTSIGGATVSITVTDTGSGIPRAHLPHVFERFFGTNSGSRRGTGLGLAIVQSVAEAHGGHAAITSEEGVGTAVTLTLPVGADSGVAAGSLLARERA